MKNTRIATKISVIITIVLLVGFFILWKTVDEKTTSLVESQITNQMTDAVESRSYIINNYVQSAEQYMIAFAQSDEVRNLLLHPESKEYLKRAQQYTVDFANVKGIFEGLYIASPETYVYTHTTEAVIGISTRTGEALKPFQEQILAEEKLTNLGIMKSPAGNMCISMYYPLFDNGVCIGYVGSAVYASNLMESLVSLEVKGLSNSEYVFLNAETGEYLYNEEEELLCTVTEDKGYLKMLEDINSGKSDDVGMIEYTDDQGKEQVVVYRNIPQRNWVFAVKDAKEEVYGSLQSIKRTTGIVCVLISVLVIVILIFVLSRVGQKLGLISGAIKKLGEMDLSANETVKKYADRGDEIGIICGALDQTCKNLRNYIGEVDRQLSAMSDGDFTVHTNMKFAGEFIKLQESMEKIQHSLRDSFWQINTISSELVLGSQSVSDSSSSLAEAAVRANMLVSEIDDNVNDIAKQVSDSADFAMHAKVEATDAAQLVRNGREKMDVLSKAMNQIKESARAIESISTNLEGIAKQTNILALNAMVEANRAGDEGRGFGVVADEIRILAEQSSEAANSAYDLIKETVDRVQEGLRIGEETAQYLDQVVMQTDTIDASVSRIAEASEAQNHKLQGINDRLRQIGQTVETTAAMAEQSASASVELDDQINSLRENIAHYHV